MTHPPQATHMVSLPDGEPDNNALGYCSSSSRNPNVIITLTPIGKAWSRWVLQGTHVIVKWLKLPGAPEYLHVLDAETSTTSRLPRRLMQRSAVELVRIRTPLSPYHRADTLIYYGTTAVFAGDSMTVTPLGKWRYSVPLGSAAEVINLSDPGNGIKSGTFASQSSVESQSRRPARFTKDRPGA